MEIEKDLDFSQALVAMKARKLVARAGWSEPDQFVYFVEGSRFVVNRKPLSLVYAEGEEISYRPHLDMRSGGVCTVYAPSHADILSNDWYVVRDLLEEEAERQKTGIDLRPTQ